MIDTNIIIASTLCGFLGGVLSSIIIDSIRGNSIGHAIDKLDHLIESYRNLTSLIATFKRELENFQEKNESESGYETDNGEEYDETADYGSGVH